MNGRETNPQVSSSAAAETTPVINSAQILSFYRTMNDESREALNNNIKQIENELLIERYNQLDYQDRRELFTTLTDKRKRVIFSHYLNELENSVNALEVQHNPGADLARSIAKQLRSFAQKGFQDNTGTNITGEEFLDVLHKTTDFIQTPPMNQDMTPNPAFEQRSNALTDASKSLRSSGKWQVLAGLIDTFKTLMWIGASVLLGLHLGGIIGSASTLMHAFAPLGIAMNTYMSVKDVVSAVGHFSRAHKSFSVTNKLNTLVKTMQPAEPAAETTAKAKM